jgi:hypothetical protein
VKLNGNLKYLIVRIIFFKINFIDNFFFLQDAIREKERELLNALQSQHQGTNCIFNGHHPHSHCSTSSGHSSPTHQLIDTNNNPTTTTPSCSSAIFYPPTAVTPPPLQNSTYNLDPNAQDFCLPTHSTSNN